jgi:hypothetical protein
LYIVVKESLSRSLYNDFSKAGYITSAGIVGVISRAMATSLIFDFGLITLFKYKGLSTKTVAMNSSL